VRERESVCACVFVCVRMRVCVCASACVCIQREQRIKRIHTHQCYTRTKNHTLSHTYKYTHTYDRTSRAISFASARVSDLLYCSCRALCAPSLPAPMACRGVCVCVNMYICVHLSLTCVFDTHTQTLSLSHTHTHTHTPLRSICRWCPRDPYSRERDRPRPHRR
jgi:hypothetical protein